MRRLNSVFLVYFLGATMIFAQDYQRPVISYDRFGDGLFDFYAENPNHFPVQMRLTFTELDNMQAMSELPFIATLQPGKQKLFHLRRIITEIPGSFNYKTEFMSGAFPVEHEQKAVYFLPIGKGKTSMVSVIDQSLRGLSAKKSLMFKVCSGDTVFSAREGIVCQLIKPREVQGMVRGTNTIVVLHPDNTFGRYEQLANEGFLVEPGQKIKAGEPIAIAPPEGEPQILFSVYHLNAPINRIIDERIRDHHLYVLPVFAISRDRNEMLITGNEYKRDY